MTVQSLTTKGDVSRGILICRLRWGRPGWVSGVDSVDVPFTLPLVHILVSPLSLRWSVDVLSDLKYSSC